MRAFGDPAVSEETRGFADRPRGRGAIVDVRDHLPADVQGAIRAPFR